MVGVSANTLHVLSYLTLFFIGGLDNVVVGDDYDADEHSDTDQKHAFRHVALKIDVKMFRLFIPLMCCTNFVIKLINIQKNH